MESIRSINKASWGIKLLPSSTLAIDVVSSRLFLLPSQSTALLPLKSAGRYDPMLYYPPSVCDVPDIPGAVHKFLAPLASSKQDMMCNDTGRRPLYFS